MKLIINNFKLPSVNPQYAGRHWSKRYKEAKEIQQLVWGLCKEQKLKPVKKYPVDIFITAYYKSKRLRDSSNCDAKGILDGLVLAKIIKDDDVRFVRWVGTKAIIMAKENKVVIEIKEK